MRPDASQFPHVPSGIAPGATQWSGLSGTNDGTGPLENGEHGSADNLIWSQNTFRRHPLSLRLRRRPRLYQQDVVVEGASDGRAGRHVRRSRRVACLGWRVAGVRPPDMGRLPSLGKHACLPVVHTRRDAGEHRRQLRVRALEQRRQTTSWSSTTRTYGVDLEWYKKTLPPPSPPPADLGGREAARRVQLLYRTDRPARDVGQRRHDAVAAGPTRARCRPGWVDGDGCGETSGDTWTFAPISGHSYEVRAVDFDADGCSNDPTISSCDVADVAFVGDANGIVDPVPIG